MRYQQKQMHEIAQKKNDMFDETQKMLTSSLGAGKVSKLNFLSNFVYETFPFFQGSSNV
jgi:hypothetical protein